MLHKGQHVQGKKSLYQIEGLVHTGGIAATYLGRNLGDDNSVAIKIPASDEDPHTESRHARRLRREGVVLRAVQHRAIVRLIEEFELGAAPCLVEEYVLGGRMLETFSGKPASENEALTIIDRLIDGVEVLHRHNIIHRDINPSNIIMESELGPVIVDFNICLFADERCNQAGSEPISAPEHLDERAPTASFKSDVYSLAATLLFLLTGNELDQYYRTELELDQLRSRLKLPLRAELTEVIFGGLSCDPAKRPSLTQFREAIRSVVSQAIVSPKIWIEGNLIEIRGLAEIGRQHHCQMCEGKEMIYVSDPFPYLEKHHVRLLPEKAGRVTMVVLPGRNKVAISRDKGHSFEAVGRDSSITLTKDSVVALAYDRSKGPYKTFVVN